MVADELLDQLRRERLLAIVRGGDPDRVAAVLQLLADEGIALAEVALSAGGALDCLAAAVRTLGGRIHLGAGTVLDAEQVAAARDVGAEFIVTPAVIEEVTEAARSAGIALLPGASTPREVLEACKTGAASAVKLFPARELGGAAYVAALGGPFPDLPLVPVGGVNVANVGAYLRAGAVAVGCGGPLIGDALSGGDLGALAFRARAFRTAVGR